MSSPCTSGVDCEVLGSLNMDIACCICFQMPHPQEAVCIHPCMHVFCRSCLAQAFGKRMECPIDRRPVENTATTVTAPSPDTLFRIQEVPVRCSRRAAGCEWEGTWGAWCSEHHGSTCRFAPAATCPVPGCSDAVRQAGAPAVCSEHETTNTALHVRLLTDALAESEGHRRRLEVELNQLKERLYALQNDVTDFQHRQRREAETSGSSAGMTAMQVGWLLEQDRRNWPSFRVPSVPAAVSAFATAPCAEWDALSRSRTAVTDRSVLRHAGGGARGWATALTKIPVVLHRDASTRCRIVFRVLPPQGSAIVPFEPSMVMFGLSVSRFAVMPFPHAPGATAVQTSHIGSLPGCVALQGSGFAWHGAVKQCGVLPTWSAAGGSPEAALPQAQPVNLNGSVTLHLTVTNQPHAHVSITSEVSTEDGGSRMGLVATIPFDVDRDVVQLFPAASIGAACCDVDLSFA